MHNAVEQLIDSARKVAGNNDEVRSIQIEIEMRHLPAYDELISLRTLARANGYNLIVRFPRGLFLRPLVLRQRRAIWDANCRAEPLPAVVSVEERAPIEAHGEVAGTATTIVQPSRSVLPASPTRIRTDRRNQYRERLGRQRWLHRFGEMKEGTQ